MAPTRQSELRTVDLVHDDCPAPRRTHSRTPQTLRPFCLFCRCIKKKAKNRRRQCVMMATYNLARRIRVAEEEGRKAGFLRKKTATMDAHPQTCRRRVLAENGRPGPPLSGSRCLRGNHAARAVIHCVRRARSDALVVRRQKFSVRYFFFPLHKAADIHCCERGFQVGVSLSRA